MTLYRELRDNVDGVIRRLRVHKRLHAERPRGRRAYYYEVRDRWNDRAIEWKPADRAATFIYLNRTCFNGLWRVNRAGEFNVPIGDYDNPTICATGRIRFASKLLARADIRTGDYAHAIHDAKAGDFCYFDPPYDPISATSSFTKYGADGFTRENQTELAAVARGLVDRGCHVMVSNNNTPFIRKLYREHGFTIARVSCGRAINSDAAKRGSITELLMSAGPS
jgi:DNA adenine methylase